MPGTKASSLNETQGFIAFGILLVAAAFTAFYMWRQIVLVFFDRHAQRGCQTGAQPRATAPCCCHLVVLAVFTIIIGFINVPKATPVFSSIYAPYEFKYFLEHSLVSVSRGHSLDFNLLIAGVGAGAGHCVDCCGAQYLQGQGLDRRQSRPARGSRRVRAWHSSWRTRSSTATRFMAA